VEAATAFLTTGPLEDAGDYRFVEAEAFPRFGLPVELPA
jgi:hypothetical protein